MNLNMKAQETLTSFSLFDTPLEGRHLIESSAGTGKTYTITSLLIRLLLERNIPIYRYTEDDLESDLRTLRQPER